MRTTLAEFVRLHQMGSRVQFLGHVQEAMSYIKCLDLLALPSRHEGLPMVLLEAAICRIPVVAFDVGGVSEVLDGSCSAQLIPPGDIQGFASAIERSVASHDKASMADWSSSVVSKFSLKATLESYLTLYKRVVA